MTLRHPELRRPAGGAALLILACIGTVRAQAPEPTSHPAPQASPASHDPSFAYGSIAGAADLPAGASMQALSVVLQYKPVPWVALSVNPSVVRVAAPSTTGGSVNSTGLTDLPVGVSATRKLPDAPWAPELGAGVEVTLPVGDTATGLGSGQTGVAGELGLGVSPTDNLSLDLNLWHPFRGSGVSSVLDAATATSLGLEAGYDWTEKFSTSLGFSADVGHADSASTLPQSIVAGFVFAFAKPFALTVDGAHGVTSGAPRWLVSVGIGTAFSGINPVGLNSSLSRLGHAFGRGVNRGHGKNKVGGNCKGGAC